MNTTDHKPTKDFFNLQEHSQSFDLGSFGLLPQVQGEDYEEEQFANRMKKKSRRL